MNQSTPIFGHQQFHIYPIEKAVTIIHTFAEHRWPMTINEAFTLRDQFGWKPAPDDGRFFITAVSGGEEDGSIGVDPDDRSVKCRQRVEHMEYALPVSALNRRHPQVR